MQESEFPSGLVPELDKLAHAHVKGCEAAHLHVRFYPDGGVRTRGLQMRLYEEGRELTSTGWVVVDRRKVVTDALPAKAPHCRAAAYDLWLLFGKPGEDHLRRATMDPHDGWTPAEIEQQTTLWGAVVRIGLELGLEPGATFSKLKDWPHFQMPNWKDFPIVEA